MSNTVKAATTQDWSPARFENVGVHRGDGNFLSYNISATCNLSDRGNRVDTKFNNNENNKQYPEVLNNEVQSTETVTNQQSGTEGISVVPLSSSNLRMHGTISNRAGRPQLSKIESFKDDLERSSSIFHMLKESWTTTDQKSQGLTGMLWKLLFCSCHIVTQWYPSMGSKLFTW